MELGLLLLKLVFSIVFSTELLVRTNSSNAFKTVSFSSSGWLQSFDREGSILALMEGGSGFSHADSGLMLL